MNKPIKKILVANRGEIASRVIRTVQRMGIKSVAVYSDADYGAPHTRMAEEMIRLGPPPPSDSYLSIEKVISAAKSVDADAIHPGYGFLSENAVFARAVEDEGIQFIGPGYQSIEIMGNKLEAKKLMKKRGVPVIPDSNGEVMDGSEGLRRAKKLGFPVLIKAAMGGGGKGMRIVRSEDSFQDSFDRAVSESTSSFGNGAVYIEKYLKSPRHIEIQIFADQFGNVIHLFERECSIQRRHQKVIEEAPSPFLDEELRNEMGKAAVAVGEACNYRGAGTVEFLVDENRNFYFLEMNTRLQVEHPVTEMITGFDLVEWQIRVARGELLPCRQDNVQKQGHAIELRIYAEDPFNQFFPSVGQLTKFDFGGLNLNVRLDSGYTEGMEIPIYYDPLIAKLVVHGNVRSEAIRNMKNAIKNIQIYGVQTTLPFGAFTMGHPDFIRGTYNISFIESNFNEEYYKAATDELSEAAAYLAFGEYLKKSVEPREFKGSENWKQRNLIQ